MLAEGGRQLRAGKRPKARDMLLTPANARRVADQLATMRGAAMKVGQILSMDSGEFLSNKSDGKLRSFWPQRRRAYRLLVAALRRWGGPELPVYLCMESPEMWQSAFGYGLAEGEVAAALTCGCR